MSKRRPFIVYLHIEKAAGSTLHDIFSKNILGYHILLPYFYDRKLDNQQIFLKKEELARIKKFYPLLSGIGGHSVRSYANYEHFIDKILYVTFIRNPIERFYSHYFYQKEVMSINWTLPKFIMSGHFDNFMCRKICGKPSFVDAAEEIEKKYFYVGLTEYFDNSLVEFKDKLIKLYNYSNFDITYVVKNARSSRIKSRVVIDNSFDEIVEEANIEDIKLYNFILNKKEDNINKIHIARNSKNNLSPRQCINYFGNKILRHSYIKQLEKYFRDQRFNKLAM